MSPAVAVDLVAPRGRTPGNAEPTDLRIVATQNDLSTHYEKVISSGSFSSSGSDNAHDGSITVGDGYSSSGDENDYFNETDDFTDDTADPNQDSDSGGFTQTDSADEIDTASDNWSDVEGSTSASFSESASSSPSYGYHDTGSFDLSGPGEDGDVGGDEGETDTETDTYNWGEKESISNSTSYHMNEGGGDSVTTSYGESDDWSDDTEASGETISDSGNYSDHDTATASASFNEGGHTAGTSFDITYSDGETDNARDTDDDFDDFSDDETLGGDSPGDVASDSGGFTTTDKETGDASLIESGTFSDAGVGGTGLSGTFTENPDDDEMTSFSQGGGFDDGATTSSSTQATQSDSSHDTFSENDSGQFTGNASGNFNDFASDDDTSTDFTDVTVSATPAGATTTSGTFNDDTNDIDSYGDGQTQHLGGNTSTTADYNYSSVSYHDSGTLSGDGSGAVSLSGDFHYKSQVITSDDKGDSGGLSGFDSGSHGESDDKSDIVNDTSDGDETSASGTLTQSGQETHDDKTTDDQKDNENYTFQNAGGGGAYNENDYATVNDHAHDTGDFTEVNGAITQQDTAYTDDDIDTSGHHDDSTNTTGNGASSSGGGSSSGGSSSGSGTSDVITHDITQSSSYHDGGTYDQSPDAPTTDDGNSRDTVHNTQNYSSDYTNHGATGTLTQDGANGEIDDYFTSDYSISDDVDTEHDTFDDKVHKTNSFVNSNVDPDGGVYGQMSTSDVSTVSSTSDATDDGSLDASCSLN